MTSKNGSSTNGYSPNTLASRTGGDVVCDAILEAGVDVVFGMPGVLHYRSMTLFTVIRIDFDTFRYGTNRLRDLLRMGMRVRPGRWVWLRAPRVLVRPIWSRVWLMT